MSRQATVLFQRCLMLWVLGFLLSAYSTVDGLEVMDWSMPYGVLGGIARITNWLCDHHDEPALAPLLALATIALAALELLRGPSWWRALLIWMFYVNLMNNAWLASSGGQQLIANVLFWNILLAAPGASNAAFVAKEVGFWAIRLQLLVAYLATALHKATGHSWPDGTALGIIATDPAFASPWLAAHPAAAQWLTWCTLLFQLTFPLAVWFLRTRYVWLVAGLAFHLLTAFWMDIPEMGLAFLVVYTLWLDEGFIQRSSVLRWLAKRTGHSSGTEALVSR